MSDPQFVIGVSGFATSGKGEVARTLTEMTEHKFVQIDFADTLRDVAVAANPVVSWDLGLNKPIKYNDILEAHGYAHGKKYYPEFRLFLQKMGTEAGRKVISDTIWIDKWIEKAKAALLKGHSVVASDLRFLNEADALMNLSFFQTYDAVLPHMIKRIWRVKRPGVGPQSLHESELEQLDIAHHTELDNSRTLSTLEMSVRQEIKDLLVQEQIATAAKRFNSA